MMGSNVIALSLAIILNAVIEQPQPIEGAKLDTQYMYVRQACVPRNSDECLASTPNWGPGSRCDEAGSMCVDRSGSWAKDVRRCCPETCGTGILTKDMCEALVSRGTCTYPNAAQCSEEDDACMSRTKSQPCHLIKDRDTCLTSTDSRNMIYAGEQLFGSNCNWCPDGPCTSNNANRCEPEPFLKTKGVNGYETCIKEPTTTSTTTTPTTTTTTVDTSEVICQDTNALCKMEPAFLLDILCQIETVSQQCPKRCNKCQDTETTEAPTTSTTPPEPIEYEYLGKRPRKCKNAENKHTLTCRLSDEYKDLESKYPGPKCKAACDSAASCLAIGTHYHCDRLFFSDYETALTEVPADMCKSWEYKNAADNQIFCQDIDSNDCGSVEATNGCFVKRVKTGISTTAAPETTTSAEGYYETNLEGHWDAMNPENMVKDDEGKVATWFDMKKKYDVKANSANRPTFVSNAINGFPAIDFTGYNVGLVSDVNYSKAPGQPFTWVMAVKPKAQRSWKNIFSTSDSNWDGRGYYPIAASFDGVHGWSTPSDIRGYELPVEELTIYTVWYDGTNVKIYWGNTLKTENSPTNWNKGQIGFVSMGLGVQNRGHDYSGFIGEVLAYDTALEESTLKEIIDAMTAKWTTEA